MPVIPAGGTYTIKGANDKPDNKKVLSLQSGSDPYVSPVYANPRYLSSHPLEVGTEGHAEFKWVASKNAKNEGDGFLTLSLWTPVGGVQPPVPGTAAPYIPPAHRNLDARDASIISQCAAKCAVDLANGGGSIEDFLEAHKAIHQSILERMG